MGGRLGNVPWLEWSQWLRPGTGALRPGLVRPATTGNFGVRVQFNCGGRGAKTLKEKPSAVTLPLVTEK
jgi:hypothetical protein